jgi:Tol biopolymer transport system component
VFGAEGAADFEGTWSPVSATTLLFSRGTQEPFSEEIFVGDVATGEARALTNTSSAAIAPSFSADGTRIVYFSVRPPGRGRPPGPARITIVNADGTGRRVLTPANVESIDPDFSPDATRIVYAEDRQVSPALGDSRIVVMNADGSGRRALTDWGGRRELNPKWMPDGGSIVFESATRRFLRSDIEIMGADGRGRRKLLATPAYETNPIPSPDGTRIAFTSDRDRRGPVRQGPGFELYTAKTDGTDVVRITRNRVPDIFPDWQRLP